MKTGAHFKGLDVNSFGFISVVNIRSPVMVGWITVNEYYIHPVKKMKPASLSESEVHPNLT